MPSWRATDSSITKAICSAAPCRRRISRDSPELSRRVAVRGRNAPPSIGRSHKASLEELHYLGVDIVWHCSQVSVPLRLKTTKLTGVPDERLLCATSGRSLE